MVVQLRIFNYLFCGLISLSCLPVLGWHYWHTLSGAALLSILGLALADCVLWFASHFTVSAPGPLKGVSFVVKFVMAGVMLVSAGWVVFMAREDSKGAESAARESAARIAEIEARARAAKELIGLQGGRAAAREMVRMESPALSPGPSAPASAPSWAGWGIYIAPSLVALFGALALSLSGAASMGRPIPGASGPLSFPVLPEGQGVISAGPVRGELRGKVKEQPAEPGNGSGSGGVSEPPLRYERNSKGGLEVWAGNGPRKNRRYICYLSPARVAAGDYGPFVREKLREKLGEPPTKTTP